MASLAETQVARTMIDESGELLTDIEAELLLILSGGAPRRHGRHPPAHRHDGTAPLTPT